MHQKTAAQTTLGYVEEKTVPIRVRPEILAVPAYRQGKALKQPGYKLSSNENPYPPAPQILAALRATTAVNRYIAADVQQLRTKISQFLSTTHTTQISADQISVGAGSVALLYQLIGATCGSKDNYVHAWPSFEAYPLLGTVSGAKPVAVPLTDTAAHDLDAMAAAVSENTRAVLLCTPNNPTGPVISRSEFIDFMTKVPGDILVVLDEAYAEFVSDPQAVSGVPFIETYPNLVVLRTFAKAYGLAGLRIGYGVAQPAIWDAVRPAGIPMSINAMAEAAALAALELAQDASHNKQIAALKASRLEMVNGLQSLGISVPRPEGNFVWIAASELAKFTNATDPAEAYSEFLAQNAIQVRPFANSGVRITVAEPEAVTAVLTATKAFITEAQNSKVEP